jgi:hypothetical protein
MNRFYEVMPNAWCQITSVVNKRTRRSETLTSDNPLGNSTAQFGNHGLSVADIIYSEPPSIVFVGGPDK